MSSAPAPHWLSRFPGPEPDAARQVQRTHAPWGNQTFQPLPPPTGTYPFRLRLEDVLPSSTVDQLRQSGRVVFHCVGDTGGIKNPLPQEAVASAMEQDIGAGGPSFLFHLGDVVYFNGELASYYGQFYEPYAAYQAPIFAIPGNHDGDPLDPTTEPSLTGFVTNFCSATAQPTPQAQEVQRMAMTQPNAYWTLEAPLVTIIGLYTNVPEGGQVGPDQVRWLTEELSAADPDTALIVALHHPPYSVDKFHGGSGAMGPMLDSAIQQAGRTPSAVFTAHVHNYQRFGRQLGERSVPYVVAGAGGYHNLHRVAPVNGKPISPPWQPPDMQDLTLENFCDDQYGYLRVTATQQELSVDYVAVGGLHDLPGATPSVFESWSIQLG